MSLPASLLLGALLGVAYSAAALLVARRANALEPMRGMRLMLAAMLVRMAVTLAAVVAVLLAVPVHRGAFVGGLGVTFVAGLLTEVLLVLGRTHPSDA